MSDSKFETPPNNYCIVIFIMDVQVHLGYQEGTWHGMYIGSTSFFYERGLMAMSSDVKYTFRLL